jgi:hypothetical protein
VDRKKTVSGCRKRVEKYSFLRAITVSLPNQLALLVARGLTVNDAADATHYLTTSVTIFSPAMRYLFRLAAPGLTGTISSLMSHCLLDGE